MKVSTTENREILDTRTFLVATFHTLLHPKRLQRAFFLLGLQILGVPHVEHSPGIMQNLSRASHK